MRAFESVSRRWMCWSRGCNLAVLETIRYQPHHSNFHTQSITSTHISSLSFSHRITHFSCYIDSRGSWLSLRCRSSLCWRFNSVSDNQQGSEKWHRDHQCNSWAKLSERHGVSGESIWKRMELSINTRSILINRISNLITSRFPHWILYSTSTKKFSRSHRWEWRCCWKLYDSWREINQQCRKQ